MARARAEYGAPARIGWENSGVEGTSAAKPPGAVVLPLQVLPPEANFGEAGS